MELFPIAGDRNTAWNFDKKQQIIESVPECEIIIFPRFCNRTLNLSVSQNNQAKDT